MLRAKAYNYIINSGVMDDEVSWDEADIDKLNDYVQKLIENGTDEGEEGKENIISMIKAWVSKG